MLSHLFGRGTDRNLVRRLQAAFRAGPIRDDENLRIDASSDFGG